MNSDNPSNDDSRLYGLHFIIGIQVLVLAYLLIDNFFVTDQPENVMILVVTGIAIPLFVGLYLRNNVARLAMISMGYVSIASITIGLVTKLMVLRTIMNSELLGALLKTDIIPLGFTIWVVVYLTRQGVRRHFITSRNEVVEVSESG